MSRALNTANRDVEKRQADATKWAQRADQEQQQLRALEVTLGDALVDDESAADRLPAQIDALASRLRATHRAVTSTPRPGAALRLLARGS